MIQKNVELQLLSKRKFRGLGGTKSRFFITNVYINIAHNISIVLVERERGILQSMEHPWAMGGSNLRETERERERERERESMEREKVDMHF